MIDISQFYTFGFHDEKLKKEIIYYLMQLGIYCSLNFSSPDYFYFVHERKILRTDDPASQLLVGKIQIAPIIFATMLKEAYDQIKIKLPWYTTLKVGDIVTVAERIDDCDDYPYGFTDDMAYLVGQQFEIVQIYEEHIVPNTMNARCKNFNDDLRKYILLNFPYSWHSSMFVPKETKPIKKIELTEISFISKIL